jgi:hypothetical protein
VGEGGDAVSLEIRNSSKILVANYHAYRVTRNFKPAPMAVKLYNASDIRFRNVHVNAESGYATCDANGCGTYLRASKFPFENSIVDMTHKIDTREREFAVLDIAANPARPAPSTFPASAKVEKLEDGFWSISGAAVAGDGTLYFVDHRFQRIYSWSEKAGLGVVRDNPVDPVNLAVARNGDLMVLSSLGPEAGVYSFRPGTQDGAITLIKPTPAASHPASQTLLPVNLWNNGEFKDQYDPATDHFTTLAEMFKRDMAAPKAREYVSPDGSLVLPAFRVFQQGSPDHLGWRFSDTLDAHGFVTARPEAACSSAMSPRTRPIPACSGRAAASPISSPSPTGAGKAWRWMARAGSMSPTGRSSSSIATARSWAASMCPNARCRSCLAVRRTAHFSS